MPNVACIMMQKNEDLLIEFWILHHAELFGLENLYVYDNGSDSDHVIDILRRYETAGMNVFWDQSTPRHFDLKGWIVGDLIRDLEKKSVYDFFFPLDCDEFVAMAETSGFTTSRNKILGFLDTMRGCDKVLRVNHCLINVPGSLNVFGIVGHTKSIVPAGSFRAIDHGFHEAELEGGKAFRNTPIMHVHLHNKPFAMLLQHAKDKLQPYVDVNDLEALSRFDGCGWHLKKYFFGFEGAYMASLGSVVRVDFEGLARRAAAFGLGDFVTQWTAAREPDAVATRPNVFLDGQMSANEDQRPVSSEEGGFPFIITYLLDLHRRTQDLIDASRRDGLDAIGNRDWNAALESWSAVRRLAPFDVEGYAMGVLAYREATRYDEAEALANLALAGFPNAFRLLVERALITFPTKQWKQGRVRFNELRRRFPNETEGYVRGIEVALNLDDLDEARRIREMGMRRFGASSAFEEQVRRYPIDAAYQVA